MKLIRALRYSHPSTIAFVGAGGKTTAIFQAAREIMAANKVEKDPGVIFGEAVLVATTTHLGAWQSIQADQHVKISSRQDLAGLDHQLAGGIVLLTGEEKDNRLGGLNPVQLDRIHRLAIEYNLPLLFEADGSHSLSLKAPAKHEPAIPEFVEQVVVVVGLSGIGKPLSKLWVHRPELFGELTGLHLGENVTRSAVVQMLLSTEGGLKNIPTRARKTALLNQADSLDLQSQAKMIGEKLLPAYHGAIIAALFQGKNGGQASRNEEGEGIRAIHAVLEPIGGVILAAGESSRFGEPKQLLLWKGIPLIRHVVVNALKAGLSPVVVVVGSSAVEVQSAIDDLPVRIVNNREWLNGMSSSIKAGLATLPEEVGGVVFLQADQPQIPPALIKELVEAHQVSLSPIVAPQIDGQRGNPVLFDTVTFKEILAIEGDIGGRALFSRFPVEWVTWQDANLLLDIDSKEDYLRFLSAYPDREVEI